MDYMTKIIIATLIGVAISFSVLVLGVMWTDRQYDKRRLPECFGEHHEPPMSRCYRCADSWLCKQKQEHPSCDSPS